MWVPNYLGFESWYAIPVTTVSVSYLSYTTFAGIYSWHFIMHNKYTLPGARQLETSPATIDVLPSIREAVGPDVPIVLDGGKVHTRAWPQAYTSRPTLMI